MQPSVRQRVCAGVGGRGCGRRMSSMHKDPPGEPHARASSVVKSNRTRASVRVNDDLRITKTSKTGNDPVDMKKSGQKDLKTSGDANKTSPRNDTIENLLQGSKTQH